MEFQADGSTMIRSAIARGFVVATQKPNWASLAKQAIRTTIVTTKKLGSNRSLEEADEKTLMSASGRPSDDQIASPVMPSPETSISNPTPCRFGSAGQVTTRLAGSISIEK